MPLTLDTKMPNGKTLGKCTREDLLSIAAALKLLGEKMSKHAETPIGDIDLTPAGDSTFGLEHSEPDARVMVT